MEERQSAEAKKPILQRHAELILGALNSQNTPSLGRMKLFAELESHALSQLEALRPSSKADFQLLKSDRISKIMSDAKYYVLNPGEENLFQDGDQKRL